MTTQHMPGPWKHVLRTQEGNEVLGPDGRQVAAVSGDSPEEEAANAKLMASAPDMSATLEYLREFIVALDPIVGSGHTAKTKRYALEKIAKAKGEQS